MGRRTGIHRLLEIAEDVSKDTSLRPELDETSEVIRMIDRETGELVGEFGLPDDPVGKKSKGEA